MEIVGSLQTSALMALVAVFLVQGVKRLVSEEFYRFIPFPLAVATVGVGVLLAWLTGNVGQGLVTGGIEGFIAATFAVYGWEFFEQFQKRG